MDEQFEEIKKRYDDSNNDEEVKKIFRKGILFCIGGICLFILIPFLGLFSLILLFMVVLMIVIGCCYFSESIKLKDYNHKYNYYNLLVKETLKMLYENVSFDISDKYYNEANMLYKNIAFDTSYSSFKLDSYWMMNCDDHIIKIYDVQADKTKSKNKEEYVQYISFNGIFAVIDLSQNLSGEIQINKKGKNYNDLVKVEMDSVDFNKEYQVYASDKVLAMQLLTHDVMDKILNVINRYDFDIEFRIIKDKIYFRLFSDGTFYEDSYTNNVEKVYNNGKLFKDILGIIETSISDNCSD